MTGWRVGYVLGPEPLIREMTKLQENVAACASSISQEAALAALKRGEEAVMDMLTKYRRRRATFLQEIEKTRSFSCCPPRGTFYAFVNVRRLGDKSEDIALRLLKEAKVVTVPGSAFGSGGEGYLRFSFATSEDNIREAFDRIRSIL
jgi:aminotransferase